MPRGLAFWMLQGPGGVLLVYLVYAQVIPAFDYDLGVAMGTQEPAQQITPVGVAFWRGFGLGDLIVYIPLLAADLIGHFRARAWGRAALTAALGVTAYWPVVALAAVYFAREGPRGGACPKRRNTGSFCRCLRFGPSGASGE